MTSRSIRLRLLKNSVYIIILELITPCDAPLLEDENGALNKVK